MALAAESEAQLTACLPELATDGATGGRETLELRSVLGQVGITADAAGAFEQMIRDVQPAVTNEVVTDPSLLSTVLSQFFGGLRDVAASLAVLYSADWTDGLNGWTGSSDWQAHEGGLVNNGSNNDKEAWIVAPYVPGDIVNYAVEAEIEVGPSPTNCSGRGGSFGLVVRADESGAGYRAEVDTCAKKVGIRGGAEKVLSSDTGWRIYRIEVTGEAIRLFIDGELALATTNRQHRSGGHVGLFSHRIPLAVRRFDVIALEPST
jgi:hypothetical protein